jgi:hypothetical protein
MTVQPSITRDIFGPADLRALALIPACLSPPDVACTPAAYWMEGTPPSLVHVIIMIMIIM